jgi:hypothetical protein
MNAEQAPHAYAAMQKARSLSGRADASERAMIDALAIRYVEPFNAAKRVEQDRACADATGCHLDARWDGLRQADRRHLLRSADADSIRPFR